MFLVLELQRNSGTLSSVPFAYDNKREALAKYHSLLSVAVLSNVERHSVVILDDTGKELMYESYAHPTTEIEE